jgi:hypothetical protein
VAASQDALAQLQRRVDDRVRTAIEGMTSLSQIQKDLSQISSRLEALEKKISDMESR